VATRTPRLRPGYFSALLRLGIRPRTDRSRALAHTIIALARAPQLPAAADDVAPVPPTGVAYVRRVRAHNLWLWYRIRPGEVIIITVKAEPPVPSE
jgi:hypothetical protein